MPHPPHIVQSFHRFADQYILKEAERLNAVLPLIKWEVDNNDLSESYIKAFGKDTLDEEDQ